MITTEKNGYKTNKPEAGDIYISRYAEPKMFQSGKMKYPNYSLGVMFEGEECYLSLTKTQYDDLLKKGDLNDKSLKVREYNTATRDGCLALDVIGEDKAESSPTLGKPLIPLKPVIPEGISDEQKQCLESIKIWVKDGADKGQVIATIQTYFDNCEKHVAEKYYEEYK